MNRHHRADFGDENGGVKPSANRDALAGHPLSPSVRPAQRIPNLEGMHRVTKTPAKKKRQALPQRHHIDRRSADLAAAPAGSDDELLATADMARWLGCSVQWLTIGRHKGYGPPYSRIAPKMIRYRVGDARQWLAARSHTRTDEYRRPTAEANPLSVENPLQVEELQAEVEALRAEIALIKGEPNTP
jgi:hypothetical protein